MLLYLQLNIIIKCATIASIITRLLPPMLLLPMLFLISIWGNYKYTHRCCCSCFAFMLADILAVYCQSGPLHQVHEHINRSDRVNMFQRLAHAFAYVPCLY